MHKQKSKTIWIDLDNSPHVPFFRPIIAELKNRGFTVDVTIRDCAQTAGLADLLQIDGRRIGRHYGKNSFMKVAGTLFRSLQLLRTISSPALAVSHGSRSMMLLARALGIPTICIADYEHSQGLVVNSDWLVIPEIIPKSAFAKAPHRIVAYPGIKEDVYVPMFHPDPTILAELGLPNDQVIVTVRPPADQAHYHTAESDAMFHAVVTYLSKSSSVIMLILPRYANQKHDIELRYRELIDRGSVIIPEKVQNGLNLIWNSDFVVSGGGTMNREAAALRVPVYSIFQGKLGAVDEFLSHDGRLVLLQKLEDMSKIRIEKRIGPGYPRQYPNVALRSIVDTIANIWEIEAKGGIHLDISGNRHAYLPALQPTERLDRRDDTNSESDVA